MQKLNFQCDWLSNPITSGQPIIFPPHLQEIDQMAKCVKEAIWTHQVDKTLPIDDDLLLLSVPPSFTALSYKKMTACKNHFKIDDEQNNLLVTYDSSVASIF
jgi:hypothetical protein